MKVKISVEWLERGVLERRVLECAVIRLRAKRDDAKMEG